jgi:hypothetical protein
MRRTVMLLLGLVLVLFSCKHAPTYQEQVNSWVGHDANSLIRQWGPPAQSMKMPNGNTLYVYVKREVETEPTMVLPIRGSLYEATTYITVGGQTTIKTCQTAFEVDPSGRILYISVRGNDCP